MQSSNRTSRAASARRLVAAAGLAVAVAWVGSPAAALAAGSQQKTFASADAAVKALVDAISAGDRKALLAVLGPDGEKLVNSGDAVADRISRDAFLSDYGEKHNIASEGEARAVLYVGPQDWPFPIPIVKGKGGWYLDAKAGAEEVLDRRIGKNELTAMQVALAVVDAQREYASKDRDGDGLLEYATKFRSTPGKKDGLYWKTAEGEESSPLGPLAAAAHKEGYRKASAGKPAPYHGYYFRILTAQGKDAPGGAYDYLANGHLIGGVALVAYPARYGSSGVMTFIVNQDGQVYSRDLGQGTTGVVDKMTRYNPDANWKKEEVAAPSI